MIRRVLLVCSGNTCRSPMAAALLRQVWQEASPGWSLEVASAGTGAAGGEPASMHAVTALRRRGQDLSVHRSRKVSDGVLGGVDLVLTMTGRHKEYLLAAWPDLAGRVFTLNEYAGRGGDVADPYGGTLADYEATAAAMAPLLKAVVERISKEGAPTA
jgi:protein-tyrosine-phosphatase